MLGGNAFFKFSDSNSDSKIEQNYFTIKNSLFLNGRNNFKREISLKRDLDKFFQYETDSFASG